MKKNKYNRQDFSRKEIENILNKSILKFINRIIKSSIKTVVSDMSDEQVAVLLKGLEHSKNVNALDLFLNV